MIDEAVVVEMIEIDEINISFFEKYKNHFDEFRSGFFYGGKSLITHMASSPSLQVSSVISQKINVGSFEKRQRFSYI